MATWPVLFALVGISCGIRSTGDEAPDVLLQLQGMGVPSPETEKGVHVKNEIKWLLLMKEGFDEALVAKFVYEIPRLAFYASRARVWEYVGTKDELERDLKKAIEGDLEKVHLQDHVEHWIMDIEMAVVPETPIVRAAGRPPISGMWDLEQIGKVYPHVTGQGIRVFVFDTGIVESHPGFGGHVIPEFDMTIAPEGHAATGLDTGACRELDIPSCSHDHHGHGTHIAGKIAGEEVGVAPGAMLHAMKIANDKGVGKMSWVVRGFNHMFNHFEVRGSPEGFHFRTLIASVTVRARTKSSQILDSVINTAVSEEGVVVVVAAGNRAEDACGYTPANAAGALTIGAVDPELNIPPFSNYGKCVHLFAPGVSVWTLAVEQDGKFANKNGKMRATGTNMAVAQVAGAMAIFLRERPELEPARLKELVLRRAVKGAIQGPIPQDTPNKVLYLGDHNACVDTEGWLDAHGWSCRSWSWSLLSSCMQHSGYTKAELKNLQRHCSHSCGMCSRFAEVQ